MKKIFSLIFVVLMLISAVVPVFATESIKEIETVDSILVNSAREDLELVYGDKLDTEYPKNSKDNSVYLITIREYKPKDIVENIYFYFYNPSEKEIKDSDYNKVLMANMFDSNYNPTGYTKVNLKLISASDDNRFIKFCLSPVSTPKYITYNGGRHYFISGVEMESYSEKLGNNVVDYHVGYCFTFVGTGANTTCIKSKTTTLDIKVHQTSYLTGDSAKKIAANDKGNYSNQINSVYFSLPKEYEEQFGKLSSISYEYYHYRTKPILLVSDESVYNTLIKDVGKKKGNGNFGYSLSNVVHTEKGVTTAYPDYVYFGHFFGDKYTDRNSVRYRYDYYPDIGKYQDYFTSVFLVDSISKNKILLNSEVIQDYFKKYNASNYSGKTVGSKKYSADLFDLSKSGGYSGIITKTSEEVFSMESFADSENNNFFRQVYYFLSNKFGYIFESEKYDNTIENAKYIEEVTNEKLSGNETEISNLLLVSNADVSGLKSFYNDAENNNEVVYLLRYGLSDSYYNLMLAGDVNNKSCSVLFVQQDVYLDFDIIQFTFGNEENITVIPVVSTSTDGFTDVENTTPDHNVGPVVEFGHFIIDVASGIGSGLKFLWSGVDFLFSIFDFLLKYGGWIIGFVLVFWLISFVVKPIGKLKNEIEKNKYEKDKELHGKEYADAERAKRNKKKSEKAKKNFERKKKLKGLYQKIKVKFKQYSYNRKQQK
ncbi:MAG: hypothetical protein IJW79_11065, partial [Clostridia bacterium]|nr:hypothetical protein [Clostridia bacterium]